MAGVTCMEVGRTVQDVRSNFPRCRSLKRLRDEVHVSLVVAIQGAAEERFLVAKCGIEGRPLYPGSLGQVSVGSTLVTFTPENA